MLSLGFMLHGSAQAETDSPAAAEVLVDGKLLAPTGGAYRLSAAHQSVSFRLGRRPEDETGGNRRVRFRLEGVDSSWREMRSEMSFMIRFANAAGDQVGQRIFTVEGVSPGWHGSIESSAFTQRRETVKVPAESAFATAAISSSGPPTAMGVYVVRDLKIFANGVGQEPIFDAATARKDGNTAAWKRSGTRPSMAKMVHTGLGEAFCILDDDPNAHAEWNLPLAAAPRVVSDSLLTVEWSELYNIGTGSRFEVNYGRLNAGTYRFLSNELDASGSPQPVERELNFIVLEPIWKNPWLWLGAAVFLSLLIWLVIWVAVRKRIRQHLARIEQEHMIERERLRIARDLHDDLGARLTHISLVSGLAESAPQNAGARDSFRQISAIARELVAALYQTVWTVNPEHDHLESLANYICQLTGNLCETAQIRCRIHSGEVPADLPVTSEVRHNLTLAVKESVHNAVKHSGAAEISVQIDFEDPRLRITIADDGCGFDPASTMAGNGIGNMRRRMALIGGALSLESTPGAGTQAHFEVPVKKTSLNR